MSDLKLIRPNLEDALSATTEAEAPREHFKLVSYLAAVIALLHLMFSRRARTELRDAFTELVSASNEVSARLARMDAEARGSRVPLRLVDGTATNEVTARLGRVRAEVRDSRVPLRLVDRTTSTDGTDEP